METGSKGDDTVNQAYVTSINAFKEEMDIVKSRTQEILRLLDITPSGSLLNDLKNLKLTIEADQKNNEVSLNEQNGKSDYVIWTKT